MILALPLLSLLLVTTAGFAAPSRRSSCHVPRFALHLHGNETQLCPPHTSPNYVAIGVGNQNYTCTSSGNYTTAGAVAQLFDISCLYGTDEFWQIQEDTYSVWSDDACTDAFDPGLAVQIKQDFGIHRLGYHYFIKNSTGSLSPKFDFTSGGPDAGDPDAFVVATKVTDIPAPNSQNVDWLKLNGVEGDLAKTVLRVRTKAGQPPVSCSPGSPEITVKYAAQYWFFGSTLNSTVEWD